MTANPPRTELGEALQAERKLRVSEVYAVNDPTVNRSALGGQLTEAIRRTDNALAVATERAERAEGELKTYASDRDFLRRTVALIEDPELHVARMLKNANAELARLRSELERKETTLAKIATIEDPFRGSHLGYLVLPILQQIANFARGALERKNNE